MSIIGVSTQPTFHIGGACSGWQIISVLFKWCYAGGSHIASGNSEDRLILCCLTVAGTVPGSSTRRDDSQEILIAARRSLSAFEISGGS